MNELNEAHESGRHVLRSQPARACSLRLCVSSDITFEPDVMWLAFQIEMLLASYDVDSKHEMHSV